MCTNAAMRTYTAPLLGCFWKLTIERETGKRLRPSAEVLALVTGLKIAATAIMSSNFSFTENQARGLSLEPFCICFAVNSADLREEGLDTAASPCVVVHKQSQ